MITWIRRSPRLRCIRQLVGSGLEGIVGFVENAVVGMQNAVASLASACFNHGGQILVALTWIVLHHPLDKVLQAIISLSLLLCNSFRHSKLTGQSIAFGIAVTIVRVMISKNIIAIFIRVPTVAAPAFLTGFVNRLRLLVDSRRTLNNNLWLPEPTCNW